MVGDGRWRRIEPSQRKNVCYSGKNLPNGERKAKTTQPKRRYAKKRAGGARQTTSSGICLLPGTVVPASWFSTNPRDILSASQSCSPPNTGLSHLFYLSMLLFFREQMTVAWGESTLLPTYCIIAKFYLGKAVSDSIPPSFNRQCAVPLLTPSKGYPRYRC